MLTVLVSWPRDDGGSHVVAVGEAETVGALKDKVAEELKVSSDEFVLHHEGCEVGTACLVKETALTEGCIVEARPVAPADKNAEPPCDTTAAKEHSDLARQTTDDPATENGDKPRVRRKTVRSKEARQRRLKAFVAMRKRHKEATTQQEKEEGKAVMHIEHTSDGGGGTTEPGEGNPTTHPRTSRGHRSVEAIERRLNALKERRRILRRRRAEQAATSNTEQATTDKDCSKPAVRKTRKEKKAAGKVADSEDTDTPAAAHHRNEKIFKKKAKKKKKPIAQTRLMLLEDISKQLRKSPIYCRT